VMDMIGVHNQSRCLELVHRTFHHFLKIDNDNRKAKMESLKHGKR